MATITDIVNSIYRRTKTNSTSFSATDMLIAINAAQNKVNSIIRRFVDNYRPTDFTAAEVTTGTRVPILDAEFHEAIPVWVSWQYAIENNLPIANGLLNEFLIIEKEIIKFYGSRNYKIFSITIASPGVITRDKHGLQTNDRISMITTGALPTGISADTYYYVIYSTEHTFKLAATRDGAEINTSGSQSETHYYFTDKQARLTISSDSNK